MGKKLDVTQIQDEDGHWYWIPNRLLVEFRLDLQEIEGKDYMDCPDTFDSFSQHYEQYRTGGVQDLVPDFFKQDIDVRASKETN